MKTWLLMRFPVDQIPGIGDDNWVGLYDSLGGAVGKAEELNTGYTYWTVVEIAIHLDGSAEWKTVEVGI